MPADNLEPTEVEKKDSCTCCGRKEHQKDNKSDVLLALFNVPNKDQKKKCRKIVSKEDISCKTYVRIMEAEPEFLERREKLSYDSLKFEKYICIESNIPGEVLLPLT